MGLMLLIQGLLVYIDDFYNINIQVYVWLTSFVFYVFMPLVGTGYTAIYSDSSSKDSQGKVMGGMGQIYSLTWFIGELFIGYIV
jgi:hypothetical protein